MRHVVWDWNGTLFDDLHIVVEAVNVGLASVRAGPISLDDYRDHYTRPVRTFYERLLGRGVPASEWEDLDRRFHDGYRALLASAALTADAAEALEAVRQRGISQSLLSMFPHEELVPLVGRLGIGAYFDRIDGLRGPAGDAKATYLEEHLRRQIGGVDPAEVLVVGDTVDDAVAAAHVGARCVLYDNGSHHRWTLDHLGVPVSGSLVGALRAGGVLPHGDAGTAGP
jgi:phosphoglycolate phosphatase-like HAD superfamily hydrolase